MSPPSCMDWQSPWIPPTIRRPWRVYEEDLEDKVADLSSQGAKADTQLRERLAAVQSVGAYAAFLRLAESEQRNYVEVSLMELAAYVCWRRTQANGLDDTGHDFDAAWDKLDCEMKGEYVPEDPRAVLAEDADGMWTPLLADGPPQCGADLIPPSRAMQVEQPAPPTPTELSEAPPPSIPAPTPTLTAKPPTKTTAAAAAAVPTATPTPVKKKNAPAVTKREVTVNSAPPAAAPAPSPAPTPAPERTAPPVVTKREPEAAKAAPAGAPAAPAQAKASGSAPASAPPPTSTKVVKREPPPADAQGSKALPRKQSTGPDRSTAISNARAALAGLAAGKEAVAPAAAVAQATAAAAAQAAAHKAGEVATASQEEPAKTARGGRSRAKGATPAAADTSAGPAAPDVPSQTSAGAATAGRGRGRGRGRGATAAAAAPSAGATTPEPPSQKATTPEPPSQKTAARGDSIGSRPPLKLAASPKAAPPTAAAAPQSPPKAAQAAAASSSPAPNSERRRLMRMQEVTPASQPIAQSKEPRPGASKRLRTDEGKLPPQPVASSQGRELRSSTRLAANSEASQAAAPQGRVAASSTTTKIPAKKRLRSEGDEDAFEGEWLQKPPRRKSAEDTGTGWKGKLAPANMCPEALDAKCTVCGLDTAEDDNDLALCDRCDRGFHQRCHDPPVEFFGNPDDQWFCRECTEALAEQRGLHLGVGDFCWVRASAEQPWPARVLRIDFSSLADPRPYWVQFFDTGPCQGVWTGEGQVLAWEEGPGFAELKDARRKLAVRLAEGDGAVPISSANVERAPVKPVVIPSMKRLRDNGEFDPAGAAQQQPPKSRHRSASTSQLSESRESQELLEADS